jgi:hypothetical protein
MSQFLEMNWKYSLRYPNCLDLISLHEPIPWKELADPVKTGYFGDVSGLHVPIHFKELEGVRVRGAKTFT